MNNRTSVATLQRQSTYELGREIQKGEKITGGFGKTFYKATWLNGENLPIVLLEMKGNKVEVEALLYITLHHPHIIKTYGLVNPNDQLIGSDSVLLLQEYAKDGDIARLLSAQHFIPSQYVLIEIFIQISSAMIYLAENDIIHGDLACRNALVFKSDPHDPKKNLIKLIDFGLTHNELQKFYVVEADRIIQKDLTEIYDDEEVCKQKLHGKILTRPDKCDPNLWKLMIVCWNDRFHDRPTFNMIHKQLESIQNVQPSSSSLLSNSMLLSSSSSIVEKHPCLFAIIYEHCHDCHLPYTDYDSHLDSCGEKILKQCNENDRRRLVNKRRQIELSKITVKVECLFCRQRCSLNESENHQNKCSFNPKHIPDVSDIQSTGRRTSIPNDISSTPSFRKLLTPSEGYIKI
ncbi:unnamed protein product [Rotaria socialis]|uniref:Protein kinase domain-containing protein n=1 Tax=Rotaria socialis TaxID=392032 RepID=A0A821S1F7_9BILA|nr:unnamed protein product [Rotaria socialis]